jgi:hypothetical protein
MFPPLTLWHIAVHITLAYLHEQVVLFEQSIMNLQVLNPPSVFSLVLTSFTGNLMFTSDEAMFIPRRVPVCWSLQSKKFDFDFFAGPTL